MVETQSQVLDLTKQPVKMKPLKLEVQRKLLKKAVSEYYNENPVGALYALIEKECFSLEFMNADKNHKAILRIDGLSFENVATQKKKARDGVAVKALKHIFADFIRKENENLGHNLFDKRVNGPYSFLAATMPIKSKREKLHANEVNEKHVKKSKRSNSQLAIKNNIKSDVLERLVQQALGLLKCDNPNTVTALYALYEKDSFYFDIISVGNNINFLAKLYLNGKCYEASANSKKKAKSDATKKALQDLFPDIAKGESSDKLQSNNENMKSVTTTGINNNTFSMQLDLSLNVNHSGPKNTENSKFSDMIATLIQSKYNMLTASMSEHLQRYSVLAGIMMIRNNDPTVICICTGNKCLQGDEVSVKGGVLHDCHAEILAKRCLIVYLYSQLELLLKHNCETIIERSDTNYRIRDNVKFYLYISSAPCGDGRVFNFSATKNPERPKLLTKRGILRVKLESGMGGIPVSEYAELTPTYEGYLKGQPFILMCCSAKLMRANVLGIQGSLLSHFLAPVYFDGVVIGDIFHKGNVTRALYDRVDNVVLQDLPKPYILNKPFVEGITNSKITINVKPGKSCMNWVIDSDIECISTKTGKTLVGNISRLCKLNLFKKFLNIISLSGNHKLEQAISNSYREYKESSNDYQEAKKIFFKALESNLRGKWIRKPKELDLFVVDNLI